MQYSGRLGGSMSGVMRYVLVLCAAIAVIVPAVPAGAGAIRGVVVFTGAAEQKKLPVTIDQYICGKEKQAEDLLVGAQRGIRNAVVWLQTPPPAAHWPNAPVKAEMDQKACAFVPRVVLVPVGGTVEFLNSDRLLHNLHSASKDNPTFNRTQPRGRAIPIAFAKPEIVRINCDLHSWMRAWVVVMDHPFYAVSDSEGQFSLDKVPPGKYTLNVWHETLGTVTKDVTVGETDATTVIEVGRK